MTIEKNKIKRQLLRVGEERVKPEKTQRIPNVFIAGEGQEVNGGEVGVHRQQVERQQHRHDFHDQPHQRRAGLNPQKLRRKPEGAQNKSL